MIRTFKSLLLCCALALSSGCADTTYHASTLATGGLAGGLAGAGTGALIGAALTNGDIAASALLGGAVGIPVGLAIAAIYEYNSAENVGYRKQLIIDQNQQEIFDRQREIDSIREHLRGDGPTGNPSESERYYHYDGNTYGNYYR